MADKITWADKESLVTDPTIAEKNKVTDNNMNEIKSAVNNNADQLDETIVIGDENITNNSRGVINESETLPYINSEIAIGSTNPYNQRTWFKQGKNLFGNYVIVNGWIHENTMRVNYSNGNRMAFIPCQPNTTYTVSRSVITSSFRVGDYTSIPQMTGSNVDSTLTKQCIEQDTATTITYTTSSSAKYLIVHYGNVSVDTNINDSLASIQVELGTTATSYEAYVNPSIIIDDRIMYSKEKLYSTTLWENASGTHESFTLNDDIKNYDEIEITFGRSSWTSMKQKLKCIPASSGTTPCGLTAMYPASNNTALIVANAILEIGSNGTSANFPRMTSGSITSSGYAVESGTYLNVYKVVGYK